MRHELEVVDGAQAGRRIPVRGELLLGRAAEADGRFVEDRDISRRHARLVPDPDGGLVIEDLNSANGTWVNGRRIVVAQPVRDGDRIRIGATTLLVHAEKPLPPPPPLPPPAPRPDDATRGAGDQGAVADRGDQLKAIEGKIVGRRLNPKAELILGRAAEGEGNLGEDNEASRRHARVTRGEDGQLVVEDLGSANGTFVDGERTQGPVALVAGDTLKIGQTILVVTDAQGGLPPATMIGSELGPAPTGERLELVSGPGGRRQLPLDGTLLLGRSVRGDGRLADDPEVSRKHARITRQADGSLVVEDLGSGNGTWVNGVRVDGLLPIGQGDRLKIGESILVVTDPYGRLPEPSGVHRVPVGRQPLLPKIAAFVDRRHWLVLGLVALFVVVSGAVGGNVATKLSQGNDFNDPNSPSVLADERLTEAAGAQPSPGVIALYRTPRGRIGDPTLDRRARRQGERAQRLAREAREAREDIATPQDQADAQEAATEAQEASDTADATADRARDARSASARREVRRVKNILNDDPGIDRTLTYYGTFSPSFVSDDRRSTFIGAFMKDGADQDKMAERLTEKFEEEEQEDWKIGGSALAGPATGVQAETDLRTAESIALPLLFLASLYVFRGVVAAMLPVFVGIVTVLGTFLGLTLLNEVRLQSIFALNMVVGLGLGLAIDYSLFILSRYREELARGLTQGEALRRTLETAGKTILFSSAVVSAALGSLLLFPQRFLASMGAGGLICTNIAMVTALVALPALLAALGPRVNALSPKSWRAASERDARGEQAGFWYRLSTFVMKRPLPIALVCGAFLVAAGLPFLNVKFTGVDASVLPTSSPVRQVDDTLTSDFSDNPASPIALAIDAPKNAREELEGYAGDLRELPGVDSVSAPDRVRGELWQIDVTPERGPFEDETQRLVERIRTGDAPFPVEATGEAASFSDQQDSLASKLPLALGLLVAQTLVILFVLTGSVLLPIKSVIMNFLGLCATFGILVLIFQDGRLEGLLDFESEGALNATQPILLFIVAFGLSTDYGVFLLTRIKEQHDAGAPNTVAVATGLERTGRIVTAAALLFSIALGAFATSKIVFIKLVGLGAVIAVIIDSSIIRALLVPALMAMLGTRNWWAPKVLRRIHDKVGVSEH